jgi:predicted enzyme related to lactoylglutathione lyase
MSKSKSALNWFELPVSDLDRAAKFYGDVLGETLRKEAGNMAIFPYQGDTAVSGALVSGRGAPIAGGAVIYLNLDGRLEECLARVRASGGEIMQPKTSVGEHGFIAMVKDTEGNVVGFHTAR